MSSSLSLLLYLSINISLSVILNARDELEEMYDVLFDKYEKTNLLQVFNPSFPAIDVGLIVFDYFH